MNRRDFTYPAAEHKAFTPNFLIANAGLEFRLSHSKQSHLKISDRKWIAFCQQKSLASRPQARTRCSFPPPVNSPLRCHPERSEGSRFQPRANPVPGLLTLGAVPLCSFLPEPCPGIAQSTVRLGQRDAAKRRCSIHLGALPSGPRNALNDSNSCLEVVG
jgi:hypothetical protein